jgi:hypothetical protein
MPGRCFMERDYGFMSSFRLRFFAAKRRRELFSCDKRVKIFKMLFSEKTAT